MKPTDKQIGMIAYQVRSKVDHLIPDVMRKDGKVNYKYIAFEEYARTRDLREVSEIIGTLVDEAIPQENKEEQFKQFIKDYEPDKYPTS